MKRVNILNLHVQYDPSKYGGDVNYVKWLYRKLYRTKIDIVVIDNKKEITTIKSDKDVTCIKGDNSIWDFSGWREGMSKLGSKINKYDLLILSNDSCSLNGGEYESELRDVIFEYIYSENIATGIVWAINKYNDRRGLLFFKPQEYFVKTLKLRYWIRSNFIIIPVPIWNKIGWKLIKKEKIFKNEFSDYPFKKNKLSNNLQNMIFNYLCSTDKNEKKIWHSRFNYESINYDLFCKKATTIVNEMWLSALLSNSNVNIIDIRLLKALLILDCILQNIDINIVNLLIKKELVYNTIYYYSKRILKLINKNAKK